jgi:4-hydroxy-tetrahydrodipicolinate synthase
VKLVEPPSRSSASPIVFIGKNSRGEIDWAAFAKICERQIEAGAAAIVVAETAGEASNLTTTEHDAVVRAAVSIAQGRIRVIAGAGSNSTGQAIELARRAEQAGADAVLSVVPYYNKPMQAEISAHFQAVAGATSLPIILHDIPSRTGRELADDTLVRLAESKQFIGLRDRTSDMTRPMRLRPLLPPGFRLLSGEDATGLAFLANGGDGCISIIDNIECRARSVPGNLFELPTGPVAVRAILIQSAGAIDEFSHKGKPGRAEICDVPAGLYAPEHAPAHH